MSLWGYQYLAQNIYFIIYYYYYQQECLSFVFYEPYLSVSYLLINSIPIIKIKNINRIKSNLRIGPHNLDILSIIFGSLLGDGHTEFREKGNGTRICFYQDGSHVNYLIWLHNLITNLGYCNPFLPKLKTRLSSKGKVIKIIRFKT